jgi:hypothetical protein
MHIFPLIVLPIIIAYSIAMRVAQGRWDRDRIRRYIEESGGRMITAKWTLFGPPSFGESRDATYRVRYVDRDQKEHVAYCQTSKWLGVYLTEDRIVSSL